MSDPTIRGCQELTGGSQSIDAIDGAALINKDAFITFKDNDVYFHKTDLTGGAGESAPNVIVPDTNSGTINMTISHPYNCPKLASQGADYTAATFRGNIGCGTMATQNADAVNMTGGTMSGVNATIVAGSISLGTSGVTADGDKLQITYSPTYYVPSTTPSEADATTDLTAHLYGIDMQLVNIGGGQAPQSVAFSIYGGNASDGDHTVTGTEVITENKQYNTLTVPNGTTLVFGLGCEVVGFRKLVGGASGKINSIGVDGSGTTGGANTYVAGTDGDGGSVGANPGVGGAGYDGAYLGAGGGGGAANSTYNGGAGGAGSGAGGAGGTAPDGNGVAGTAMSTPTSWTDCIGAVSGGGGSGGHNTVSGYTGQGGGSGAKFCCLEGVEVELASGFQINSYGGAGAGTGLTSRCGGGGGGGGGVWLRYQIGTLLLHSVNVNGGAGGNTSTISDGAAGGLGLYREEHVVASSVYGVSIAHYDFAVDGGATCTLDQEIPDNAVVIRSTLEVITEPDSSGDTATVALSYETAEDLLAATVEGSLSAGFYDLVPNGAAANMIKIDGAKGVTVTIANENLTSGEFYILSYYVVTE